MTALKSQVGGDHYTKLKIQPVEYIHANNIPFMEGCIIKYVTRWRDKGGIKDLDKAIHFINLLKELENDALGDVPIDTPVSIDYGPTGLARELGTSVDVLRVCGG
jgi:Protein of unknwon function (DUF3310)